MQISAFRQRGDIAVTLCLGGLLLLAAAAYWPGLSGWLLLDDFVNLENLRHLDSGEMHWREVVAANGSGELGRPVAMWTFVANWLSSGDRVWDMKLTNLALHLICGLLVFWLSGRLLVETFVGAGTGRWWVALWVAAAWLLAPLLLSTVLYLVQRMAQLAALFSLAGLLCYVIGRQNLERRFLAGGLLLSAGFLVCWPMAVLSKENGALLPLLALVLEVFFFRFRADRRARYLLAVLFLALVGMPALLALGLVAWDPQWVMADYARRDFSLGDRLLTEPRVLATYLHHLILPAGADLGVFHDDYPKSSGLLDPPSTLLSILFWVAVLGAAWHLRRRNAGYVLAGLVFFLAAHSLEGSVFALELYFEHRNYLPAFGVFLALGLVGYRLVGLLRYRRLFVALFFLIPAEYALATYQRALNWSNPAEVLLVSETAHPRSPRLHVALASMYLEVGDVDTAVRHLDRAEGLDAPGRNSAGFTLHRLMTYCLGDRAVPESEYRRMRRPLTFDNDTYATSSLMLLVKAAAAGKCEELDLPAVAGAVDRWATEPPSPGSRNAYWHVYNQTARLLDMVGRKGDAIDYLHKAIALYPDRLWTSLLAVQYQLAAGDLDGARETWSLVERYAGHASQGQKKVIWFYRNLLSRR